MAAAFFVFRSCINQSKDALLKSSFVVRTPVINQSKGMPNNARSIFHWPNSHFTRPTLKERLLALKQRNRLYSEEGLSLGVNALGLGALCYYALHLSSEPGALEKSTLWPQYVKDRINSTYMYFGGSVAITAASAYAILQSPKLSRMMGNSWLAFSATLVAMIGSAFVVHFMPYSEGFGGKQVAWMVHSGIMGALIVPLCQGLPLLLRAACYSAGLVGGFSALGACSPSEEFLYYWGPLAFSFGLPIALSIATMLSPTIAVGAGLFSITILGSLAISGVFLFYDSKCIIRMAETYPTDAVQPYDPVNESTILKRTYMLLADDDD